MTALHDLQKSNPWQELWKGFGQLALVFFIIFAFGLLAFSPRGESIKSLSLVFSSIVLEAMPFMLFGSLVGGLIEAFVSRERMTALLPKKGWVTVCLAAGMGFLFPVCECAVVPVVRRLARKGLPASAAIAYLLGGPVFNPIVGASTLMAYKLDWKVVAVRLVGGYLIAAVVGLIIGRIFKDEEIIRPDLRDEEHTHKHESSCSCGYDHDGHDHHHKKEAHKHNTDHDHEHGHKHSHELPHDHEAGCSCGHEHASSNDSFFKKVTFAFRHAAEDFIGVGHFLIIGAFIAALAQTFIERKAFLEFTSSPYLSIIAMMILAILLNLCSEADAFIAASFRGLMPMSGQMAFLLTGPMFDLKLLLMYQGVFRKRAIIVLSALILLAVLAVSVLVELTEVLL